MGLKKTNYTCEKLGLTLPAAYAAFRRFTSIVGDTWTAEFGIQTSRENALNKNIEPLERVLVTFKFEDRNENPIFTAYKVAKSEVPDERDGHFEMRRTPLFGWEDDFVKA